MSLARGANYSQAGMHAVLTDQYVVSDSVRLADATAGSRYVISEGAESDERLKERAWKPGVTVLRAMAMVAICAVLLYAVYASREKQIKRLDTEVNRMYDSLDALALENQQLEITLQAQKETTRIDYEAVQVLGMIPREETEIYRIAAPDPRPFENRTVKTAAGL